MSHLPLDARAILEYLNELGYRNITAAQLKEFMKGMQPHSEVPSTATKTTTTTTRNPITPKTTANNNKISLKSPNQCKLVKGKKPLINFKFYLDIKDQQLLKKVEYHITELGGNLEFFLTKDVTHLITDKALASSSSRNNNNSNVYCVKSPLTGGGASGGGVGGVGGGGLNIVYPITPSPYIQSPHTPATPQTPYTNQTHSGGDSATDGVASSHTRIGGVVVTTTPNQKKKISRADAMLHRALQSQQQTQQTAPLDEEKPIHLEQGTYAVWHLDHAIKFLKKVQADIKQYAKKSQQPIKGACEPIILKGNYIKIESIKRYTRPYYSVFRKIEWPKITFKEDGAFRLTPKEDELKSAKEKPLKTNAMTRKSRSSSKHNHNHMRLKAKQAPKQAAEKTAAIDNSSEKQCGVCEICKIEYDTLTIHLKTKDHEVFARNQNNYIALDSLIKTSANVDKFLDENTKTDTKQDLIEPMELDEEITKQTRKSMRIQTPPPPIKIKTKLKETESQEVAFGKKQNNRNAKKTGAKSMVPMDSPPIRHPLPTSTIYKVVEDNHSKTEPTAPKTSSIIVKFRKIRQTELTVLNGEAENFMFPRRPTSSECATDSDRQTSTDSNRIYSSSLSSETNLTENPKTPGEQASTSAPKRRKTITADSSQKNNASGTTTLASVRYQSFPNTPIQPNQASTREISDTRRNTLSKSTSQRRRRCIESEPKKAATSRSRRNQRKKRYVSEDRMGDEEEIEQANLGDDFIDSDVSEKYSPKKESKKKKKLLSFPIIKLNEGRLKEHTYAFERVPVKDIWYEVFHRQDACQERMFEYWGSTSYRKLPYELGAIPTRQLDCCKICTPVKAEIKPELICVGKPTQKRTEKSKKLKKEKEIRNSKNNTPEPHEKDSKKKPRIHNKHLNKATFLSCDLMPRKSPREHASTLAILSCLIKQRKDSEIEEPPPEPPPKEKTPEKIASPKRKTPSPVVPSPARIDTPEPLQFVSEISENVKRLRRGQKKFDEFVPSPVLLPTSSKKKQRKQKAGLEFEIDEKRLKSLDVKQKSSIELEKEIDAYLGQTSLNFPRLTPSPTLPNESSGFIDDFSSDIKLIDLIDCYDGGGQDEDESNSNDQTRPASGNLYNLFSVHNRRRKNNKVNRTGWPKKRRNLASTRQNHLLQKRERFQFFCDYQTRQKNRMLDSCGLGASSMTPPDTDLDDKDDCTQSPVPGEKAQIQMPVPDERALICKEDIVNNGYMSPSEKADNSDIFTVSSDGLDTDLDVSSNLIIKTEDIDDECTTSSTLAAPHATPEPIKLRCSPRISTPTANCKLSPAITSIMKKEVKVSCKRLRTPFRRFRQKR